MEFVQDRDCGDENDANDLLRIHVRPDCPPNAIYFLPKGSRSWNIETGETLNLAPGYYVNPRQLGVITNVK